MEPADSNKCFASGELTVPRGWADYNGHMNVGYYVVAFDKASDMVLEHLGIGEAYRFAAEASVFVLEAHVTYDREILPGDRLRFTTQFLDHDEKRLHLFHRMYHADDGFLAATNELMVMHMNLKTRRPAPFPPEVGARIVEIMDLQAGLPRPEAAGRVIGIRRR
ncbi:thioesterase family protein [Nisaea acidiphila]|uniref:Thioesterase family protein n=1 Tax=Nisaea acidiphila TaxID=1862145 RepID=A0A9J7AR67_9PROT|nr:thioesterase family protein [Nisaea acidiphila]UUX49073.1 thioesterase family protein [Nisaea acidiphila]